MSKDENLSSDVKKSPDVKNKSNSKRKRRGTPETFVLTAAVILIVFGVIMHLDFLRSSEEYKNYFTACTEQAAGTITDISAESKTGAQTKYYPKIDFRVEGASYTCDWQYTYSQYEYREGDCVTIMYEPDDPENCYIDGKLPLADSRENYLSYVFAVSGVITLTYGIGKKIRRIKK